MAIKFSSLQALGRALMLPIAMLPIAGILLRFGQPDLLNIPAVASAGNAIFENLALIFAIGVSVGFAKDNNGSAGLAGAVGYLILTATLNSIDPTINTGVFGGIIIGILAGMLYNKYKDIKLPDFLSFFGGKRFISIATGLTAVVLGGILGIIWPYIQNGLGIFSTWMSESGSLGMFIYGFVNRLLLATGLHHVLNSLFWFQLGDFINAQGVIVQGDIARFMAGDPTAGHFMAGFFPIMMFGLPAICFAMYTTAHTQNKKMVAGLLLSMALTSFLTGVTEPIEYSFIFLAPVLFLIHAVLTGISMAAMFLLHVKMGFSFSAGAIDYALFFKLSTHPLYLIPVGIITFIIYYGISVFFIKKFNLETIGRESEEEMALAAASELSNESIEMKYIGALGGDENLVNVDACTTRLRLIVKDSEIIDKKLLKALGAKGVVQPAKDSVQVILGPQAEIVASSLRETLSIIRQPGYEGPHVKATNTSSTTEAETQTANTTTKTIDIESFDIAAIIENLGTKSNISSVSCEATTRVKVQLKNASKINASNLKELGVKEIISINKDTVQLYFGNIASTLADKINNSL